MGGSPAGTDWEPGRPGVFLGVNLAIAFLLELCALAALAYWGFREGTDAVNKAVLGIGAPVLAAVLWGLFAAPRARIRVPALRFTVKVAVYAAAAAGLYVTGQRLLGVLLVVVVIVNAVLIRVAGSHPYPGRS